MSQFQTWNSCPSVVVIIKKYEFCFYLQFTQHRTFLLELAAF